MNSLLSILLFILVFKQTGRGNKGIRIRWIKNSPIGVFTVTTVNNGHRHVSSPGKGVDNRLGEIVFHKNNYSVNLVLCCKFFTLNDYISVFPIQAYRRPNVTLP